MFDYFPWWAYLQQMSQRQNSSIVPRFCCQEGHTLQQTTGTVYPSSWWRVEINRTKFLKLCLWNVPFQLKTCCSNVCTSRKHHCLNMRHTIWDFGEMGKRRDRMAWQAPTAQARPMAQARPTAQAQKSRNPGTWKSGNLGPPKWKKKHNSSQNQNPFCPKCRQGLDK